MKLNNEAYIKTMQAIERTPLTLKELGYLYLQYDYGWNQTRIAKHFDLSRSSISKTFVEMRKKIRENLQ